MKTFLLTLAFCLDAATALAQLAPAPGAGAPDPAAANNRLAPPPGGPAAPASNAMFAAIDVDGDGVISARELKKAIVRLKTLDADKDGTLTLAEVAPQGAAGAPAAGQAAPFGDVAQMVDRLMLNDLNGDGRLTANELPPQVAQQMQQMLQGADKDGDGALNRQELMAAMQGMQNRQPNGLAGQPGGPNQFQGGSGNVQAGQDAAGGEQGKLMGRIRQQFDRNGDGQLGGDEVPQQQRSLFRGGDLNNDGLIDPAELRLVIERNGDRMRAQLARDRDGQDRPGRNAAEEGKNADDGKGGKQ
jgi:Ca2+-binding EF-hand superfamily protein